LRRFWLTEGEGKEKEEEHIQHSFFFLLPLLLPGTREKWAATADSFSQQQQWRWRRWWWKEALLLLLMKKKASRQAFVFVWAWGKPFFVRSSVRSWGTGHRTVAGLVEWLAGWPARVGWLAWDFEKEERRAAALFRRI